MEKEGNCFSRFSTSDDGEKVVIKLNGTQNFGGVHKKITKPLFEEPPPTTPYSSTSISIMHNPAVRNIHEIKGEPMMIKRETVSGNHTTHVQKSTHRVEHLRKPHSFVIQTSQSSRKMNSPVVDHQPQTVNRENIPTSSRTIDKSRIGNRKGRQLAIKSKNKNLNIRDEDADIFSDDEFDEKRADQDLLRLVKNELLSYIDEKPSRKFKSGEYTWTEIKPYIVDMHFPRFRQYLKDKNVIAPNAMIFRCIKDLHISRRDSWLKKRRKEREQRSEDAMRSVEPAKPKPDGYIEYKMKS